LGFAQLPAPARRRHALVVPGATETLRVNGRATILRDGPLLERLALRGEVPHLAVVVEVEALFVHCGRAFLRSSLWDASTWPDGATVPTAGERFHSRQATAH
jgi:predicted pyridoxine 5'-phosphate oxidase superfamily flavin-nucleotide-binding protein